MQTFITHVDFNISASHLDNKRLNKQLLEGRQILDVLATRRTVGGWVNHPAVRMWHGYERIFYKYLVAIKDECVKRGISTEKNWQAIEELMRKGKYNFSPNEINPWWLTDPSMAVRITQSHRANLYKKDPEYYYDFAINAKLFDEMRHRVVCCDKCNYCWPSHVAKQNQEKELNAWLSRPLP
jgi:hypothetical protein